MCFVIEKNKTLFELVRVFEDSDEHPCNGCWFFEKDQDLTGCSFTSMSGDMLCGANKIWVKLKRDEKDGS